MVVFGSGKARTVSNSRLGKAEIVLDLSSVPSELFRLQTVAERSESWASGLAGWLEDQGTESSQLDSQSDRRLYARSAIAAGRVDMAKDSGLSQEEILWLQMHSAMSYGDSDVAVEKALALPPDRFPDKVAVLARALSVGDYSLTGDEADLLDGWPSSMTGVLALRMAAALPIDENRWDVVCQELGLSPEDDETFWLHALAAGESSVEESSEKAARIFESVASGNRPAASGQHSEPVSLEEKAIAARKGYIALLAPNEALDLWRSARRALDDLVDDFQVELTEAESDLPDELVARVNPDSLPQHALESLNHTWEIARRRYERGVEGEWGSTAADFHYAALTALRKGDISRAGDLEDSNGVLEAVVASFEEQQLVGKALDDPTTWSVLVDLIGPEDIPGQSEHAGPWYLSRGIAQLLDWDWSEARDLARESLRNSNDEAVRDEALNLLAFADYQEGNYEPAMVALERALEGDYTAALQANAGIVAEHMDPDRAAYHLGQLATEAPNNDLRLAAVRRAFHIWTSNRQAWEEEEEEDGESFELPGGLIDAIRGLAVQDIELEDFRDMLRLLANFDREWLADESHTSASPHVTSVERRVFVAKASADPADYIEAIASGLKRNSDLEWLAAERDSVVNGLRSLIFKDPENVGPAVYAFTAVDIGLPMDPFDLVVLTGGAVISISRSLASEEQIPAERVVELFEQARSSVGDLSDDERNAAEEIINIAGNSLAMAIAAGHEEQLRQGLQAFERLTSQLNGIPMRRINWTEVTKALRPIHDMASESISELDRAKSYSSATELTQAIDNVAEGFNKLRRYATNPRSFFS
ncbi:MAG: hypothetical protein E2O95_04110 [Acidobacteria bacterium]|nr:MAG: hypothetical protein E2O95_04110 [Acidobacteriota bacterium]